MTQDAFLKGPWSGTSLVVQWLGLHTGGMGSVPSQGTKIPYASLTQSEKIKIIKENKELVILIDFNQSSLHFGEVLQQLSCPTMCCCVSYQRELEVLCVCECVSTQVYLCIFKQSS